MANLTTFSFNNIRNRRELDFNPARLKTARQSIGMNMSDMAKEIGVTRQSISKYEAGTSVPSDINLAKIAQATGFSASYFFKIDTHTNIGATFYRSQSSTTLKDRMRQSSRLAQLGEVINNIGDKINFPKINIIDFGANTLEDITDEGIEEATKKLRKLWNIPNGPIGDLINIVEANGILVASSDLSLNKLDGASAIVNSVPVILLADKGGSAVRRRNTIAHELGHLVMHGFIDNVFDLTSSEYKLMEKQANKFASSLLMPEDDFIEDVVSLSLDYLVELKRKWRVSVASMVMRLSQLQYISEDQSLYLNKKISKNHWRKAEPLDNVLTPEKPELFNRALGMLEDAELISYEQLKNQLGLPVEFLEEIFDKKFVVDERIEPKLRIY